MITVVLLILSTYPNETALTDHVDIMEVNHLYDNQGRLVIRQVIFWDWSPCDERHQVRAWRLLKTDRQIPRMNWRSGRYEASWIDNGRSRNVTAGERRVTFTNYDPEVLERNVMAIEDRRELTTDDEL